MASLPSLGGKLVPESNTFTQSRQQHTSGIPAPGLCELVTSVPTQPAEHRTPSITWETGHRLADSSGWAARERPWAGDTRDCELPAGKGWTAGPAYSAGNPGAGPGVTWETYSRLPWEQDQPDCRAKAVPPVVRSDRCLHPGPSGQASPGHRPGSDKPVK